MGARIAGSVADRSSSPLRIWAVCEIGTATWGLALLPILTHLADSGFGDTIPDANGWMVPTAATRLGHTLLTILLLAPPTLLMGASLPLVARPMLAGAKNIATPLAFAAAVNTAGAALGALLTDTWLVPALGILGTQIAAVTAGILSAGLALRAHSRSVGAGSGEAAAAPAPAPATRPNTMLAVALPLAAFTAMGLEILWFRFLGSALGPYRAVFSTLLAVLLIGWLLGSVLAGALHRRFGRPALLFACAELGVAVLSLAGLAAHDSRALLVRQLALTSNDHDVLRLLQHTLNLGTIAAVILPASIAMGMTFPLAAALNPERRIGANIGGIWLAITAGNAAGALVVGLWALPTFGLQHTALLLAALATVAAALLVPPIRVRSAALFAVPLAALLAFALLPADTLLWSSFPYGRARDDGVLAVREGVNETLVVTGTPDGSTRLWTNGHAMSSTTGHAQRYMRLMAHLPLLAQKDPRRVLVICFGVGNTLHAASLHPSVERLDLADISADVLAQAPLFARSNRDILSDPRVHVTVDDGRHVLRTMPLDTYDLVTLEPPPIAQAGVASLYTREFYALAHGRLRPGGWLTQWLPAYQVSDETVLAMVRAFTDVFPDAVLLVGDGRELILAGVRDGVPILNADTISSRLENAALAADLFHIGITTPRDLVATFAATGEHLRAVTRHATPMTDDRPVAESDQISHIRRTALPAELLASEEWPRFCPGLASDPELAQRMDENAALWTSHAFLTYANTQ